MADKIVVMHDGIVEQMGAPLDLYDNPANLFVAAFIGSPSMNLLKGTIRANGFETEGGVIWPVGKHPADSNDRAAVLGIRPEHLMLDPSGFPRKSWSSSRWARKPRSSSAAAART